jgi:hypothetical protein
MPRPHSAMRKVREIMLQQVRAYPLIYVGS